MTDQWPSEIIERLNSTTATYCNIIQELIDGVRHRGLPSETVAGLVLHSAQAVKLLESFQADLPSRLAPATRPVPAHEPVIDPEPSASSRGRTATLIRPEQIIDIEDALDTDGAEEAHYIWPEGAAVLSDPNVELGRLRDEPLESPAGDPWSDLQIGQKAGALISPAADARLDRISSPPSALFQAEPTPREREERHSLPPPLPVDLLEPQSIDVNPSSLGALPVHPTATSERGPKLALRVKVGLEASGHFATGFTSGITESHLDFTATADFLALSGSCKVFLTLPNGQQLRAQGIVCMATPTRDSETRFRVELALMDPENTKILTQYLTE